MSVGCVIVQLQSQLEGTAIHAVLRRQASSVSPTSPAPHKPRPQQCNPALLRERPKSECVNVRWADTIVEQVQNTGLAAVQRRLRRPSVRERPKSDLGQYKMTAHMINGNSYFRESPKADLGQYKMTAHMINGNSYFSESPKADLGQYKMTAYMINGNSYFR